MTQPRWGWRQNALCSQGRLRQPWAARLCNHFVVVPAIKRAVVLGKGALKQAHQPQRGCESQPKVGVLAYLGKVRNWRQPQRGCGLHGLRKIRKRKAWRLVNAGNTWQGMRLPLREIMGLFLSRDAVHNRLLGLERTRRQPWAGAPSGRELLSAIVPGAALRWPPAIDSCPFGAFIVPSSNGQTPGNHFVVVGGLFFKRVAGVDL